MLAALAVAPVAAQTPAGLGADCVEAGGEPATCLGGAVAGYSLLGHGSLLAGMGAPAPGTASNLGTRVGGGPRWSVFGQMGTSSWGMPDPTDPAVETELWVPAVRFGAAAGLFDGFRLMPTVGGFLALDVFADASFVLAPGSDGFDGSLRSFAAGARVGLFREGFTVPGVSLSLARRVYGDAGYGDPARGEVFGVTVDPATTSFRAVVGKDLFAVELLGGFGWDDFSGDALLLASDGAGGIVSTSGRLEGSRRVWFGSASTTFSLILSLAVEAGWAEGLDPVPALTGEHDPTEGSAFVSFSARLVL